MTATSNTVGRPRRFSGAALRAAREHAGLTVEQLALVAGRSAFTIRDYELGRIGSPSLQALVDIADRLGVELDAFFAQEAA